MYLNGAGMPAGALTTTVYSMAPASSSAVTTSRTVDCFWPTAT